MVRLIRLRRLTSGVDVPAWPGYGQERVGLEESLLAGHGVRQSLRHQDAPGVSADAADGSDQHFGITPA